MDALLPGPVAGARAAPPAATAGQRALADAAREFEAFVLKLLLGEMRKTVDEGAERDPALRGYDTLMDDALARRMAAAGSFGLAQQLLRNLPAESGT